MGLFKRIRTAEEEEIGRLASDISSMIEELEEALIREPKKLNKILIILNRLRKDVKRM